MISEYRGWSQHEVLLMSVVTVIGVKGGLLGGSTPKTGADGEDGEEEQHAGGADTIWVRVGVDVEERCVWMTMGEEAAGLAYASVLEKGLTA